MCIVSPECTSLMPFQNKLAVKFIKYSNTDCSPKPHILPCQKHVPTKRFEIIPNNQERRQQTNWTNLSNSSSREFHQKLSFYSSNLSHQHLDNYLEKITFEQMEDLYLLPLHVCTPMQRGWLKEVLKKESKTIIGNRNVKWFHINDSRNKAELTVHRWVVGLRRLTSPTNPYNLTEWFFS